MIQVTQEAVQALKDELERLGRPGAAVRILVKEKGCNCSRYRLAVEDAPAPGDRVVELEGLKVVADPRAAELLSGAVLDYVRQNGTGGFVIHPPQEVALEKHEGHGCGCGHH